VEARREAPFASRRGLWELAKLFVGVPGGGRAEVIKIGASAMPHGRMRPLTGYRSVIERYESLDPKLCVARGVGTVEPCGETTPIA
jgi:hypothetical protein